jgi:hypothetical protein
MNRKLGMPAIAGVLMCALFSSSVCRAQHQRTLNKDDQSLIAGMLR